MQIRTPDQRLRVFVSSTLRELAEERAAARGAITRLRLTPVLFELGARPHPPQELYRAYIAQSHLFVGIYWQSYGWVGPGMEISGLEDEFLLSASVPRLIYVKTPAPDREPRLAALLNRIRDEAGLSYKHFTSAAELADLVADDLALLLSEGFAAGTTVPPDTLVAPLGLDLTAAPPIPGSTGATGAPVPAAAAAPTPVGGEYPRIRVMIVDDHASVRSGLSAFLSAYDDLDLVGQAADGAEAVQLCPELHPDVVLMDMVMPVMDGATATEAALRLCPDLRVLVLTSYKQDTLVERALAAGAIGYLLKNVSGDDLAAAIRSAYAGRSTVSPEAAQVMFRSTVRRSTLAAPPIPPTSLVGRETELAYLDPLLLDPQVRLVTLTGAGGSGKTRLALEIVRVLSERFADGVAFVDLAAVRDPLLVPAAVCASLGIPDVAGWSREETLTAFLSGKEVLLVLDNLEHVVEAATFVTGLLQAATGLTVLVTSRSPLRVRGEHEYVVPPLPVPGPEVPVALSNAVHFASIRLFAERAHDSQPGFALDEDNVQAVAEICRRLDGLPLALELAAARSRLLSPAALLARLEHPLDALGEGLRDLPERQRSLRTTLAWSHRLLDPGAQRVFRSLSVFLGGCTLEAAEAVCRSDLGEGDILADLETLLEASLIARTDRPDGDVRFSMLETVRDYAGERLLAEAPDEEVGLRGRHAGWFLSLAERVDRGLHGPERARWRSLVDDDFSNLRAAVDWSCSPHGDPDVGAGILWGLCWYWEGSSHTDEAASWVEKLRACGPKGGPHEVEIEVVGGCLGWLRDDLARGRAALERALGLLQDDHAPREHAYTLALLGMIALAQRRPDEAISLLEMADPYSRQAGDPWCEAFVSYWRGDALTAAGRPDEAWTYNERALAAFRSTGDPWGVAIALFSLSWLHLGRGDLETAQASMDESARLLRSVDDRWGISWAAAGQAFFSLQTGDHETARSLFVEALESGRDHGNPAGVVVGLAGAAALAVTATAEGGGPSAEQAGRAARLLGAAAAHRERAAVMPWAFANVVLPAIERAVRPHLDTASWEAGSAAGRALSTSEAAALALE